MNKSGLQLLVYTADQLHQKDHLIRTCCEDKMRCMLDMLEIFGREEAANNVRK